MTTLSLACADAFGLLREDLYTHLEEADCLANQDSEWSGDDIQTARGLIGDLVLALPGGDDHSRIREGPGTPVRRAGPAGPG